MEAVVVCAMKDLCKYFEPGRHVKIISGSSKDRGRRRGGRGHDALIGAGVKIRRGPYKGCKGRVVDIKGMSVRVELEAPMKVVTVHHNHISDNVNVSTPFREPSRYGLGSETPSHPSRTPLHPFMTPMRYPGATPIHDGMRTPMHDRAWIPRTPPRYIVSLLRISQMA
ncbi:putative transcription elongation factor SPT5 homolog 1 isoform X2 [Lycium barbarum]|uniref:putative transcription elongation factor SPT5 homolog 1 isoform X2 n=2 Tax=Lycium barbarum TaxID=112863 RepID=UPI00293F456A|nr:putative transcription elongation factor SPT5 homolog 1 isoform X2 [Lycium barbarum]